ncbi:DUF262 domain-containing protein [Empedobacter falsenii]
MSNISIKPINELLQYNFFIPSYQRGYRWTEKQVTDLLEDINEFIPKEIPNSDEKTWYCLQPIVVKKKDDYWDVIDGQQRLTTIYLILHYLNQRYTEEGRIKLFEIKYATREGSTDYLKNEIGKIDKDYLNIDYFHISIAYKTIKEWFKEKKTEKSFELKFNDSTQVIFYETSETEDSIDIFTRINSGKIPLTNAELIKALFLNSSNFKNADLDKLRLIQLEIASEWDRIEYTLQDDSFWYFINKSENKLATRIEFIFNIMYQTAIHNDTEVLERKRLKIFTKEDIAERQKIKLTIEEQFGNDEYATFRFFNEKFKLNSDVEIHNNWQEIKKQFQLLNEWYSDRELYHKIGFLITIGVSIHSILNDKSDKSKIEFNKWITEQIVNYFTNIDIDTVEYNKNYVREILLLHNIQTMLNNKNESSRFPFDRFKKEHWDVEHIHAIATKVKVKKEEQAIWLKNNFVKTDMHKNEDKNLLIESILENNFIDENEFNEILSYVLGEEDNSLQNLCLLDRGTNRSYKNDGFKEKRRKLIKREIEGTFIPICTKNLFMKYYSDNVSDIEIWNDKDRKAYFNEISTVLNQYLPTKQTSNNE